MKTFKHLFTALLLLSCITASAHDFEVGGIYYKITDESNKTVSVTYEGSSYNYQPEYNEYTGDVVLQPTVMYGGNTYNVTGIADNAFEYCANLQSVTIPSSIKSIGYRSFENCLSLQTVNLSEGLTSIGVCAFQYCTKLTAIVIPSSVTTISNYAFRDCPKLESVTFCAQVAPTVATDVFTRISSTAVLKYPAGSDYSAWSGYFARTEEFAATIGGSCGANVNWTLKDGVLTISGSGNMNDYSYNTTPWYKYKSDIKSVIIKSGVTSIGSSAFYGCTGLTGDLVIPAGVTSIGNYAFSGCSGLTSVEIPNGVTTIGSSAFFGCTSLTNIKIPDGVTTIGSSAFEGCSGLTSIEVPGGVTGVGGNAFKGCTSLKNLYFEDGVEVLSLGKNTDSGSAYRGLFYDCPLETLYLGRNLEYDAKYDIYLPFNEKTRLKSLTIGDKVTEIGNGAFYKCSALRNIEIPQNVTNIGANAFYGCNLNVVYIKPETVLTIVSSTFGGNSNALYIVPNSVVDNYRTADVWSKYATNIVSDTKCDVDINVKAKDNTSGVLEAIGINDVVNVVNLKITGSINSYDVIQFRDKMPNLRSLDISDAKVVSSDKAFYNNNCTGDDYLGDYTFYNLTKLNYVKLPKELIAIGDYMFYGCDNLYELTIPNTVKTIGDLVFYSCDNLQEVKMPEKLESIGGSVFSLCYSLKSIEIPEGVKALRKSSAVIFDFFESCRSLQKVILPYGLEEIGKGVFTSCSGLKEIKLPPTVKIIDEEAFIGCSSLEEIRIPSSVERIGASAFANCNKLNKVYTYTVEPTAIKENTFSTFQTATLYVPSFSFYNYYWNDGWKRFLNLEEFNEPYEYFYVNNDYILDENTGYIEGTEGNNPDADINAGGGFIVEGEQGDDEIPNQSLGDVNVGCDGNGTSGSIIGDNNLHIDDLHIKINVKGGRWYFFAFPFDIKLDKISMENGSDYVFRYYDGEERAKKGNGGWKDINENHLKAARGYIFQCSANDVLVLNIEDVKFKKEDKYNELVAHVSDNLKDASWNFTGNPYLSYYDMADMDYTAPVTVWDGSKYVAIRPGDDDYHFAPYEAFFVQKPEGQEAIGFDGQEQMTKNQSNKQKEKQAAARRTRGIDPERLLINLVLGNGTSDDRTRIVFNERQSLGYETSCDATKFETAGVTQLYTIGSDKVHYAINERPADNGRVVLGYTAPTAGFYTIEAQRMDAEVYVKDFKTGTLHNLKDGAYSFGTDAGTFNDRFEILLKGTAPGTTGLNEVKGENGNVKTEIYDLQGRKMQDAENGIYIINGEKVVK